MSFVSSQNHGDLTSSVAQVFPILLETLQNATQQVNGGAVAQLAGAATPLIIAHALVA